ncbi:MAG: hypothetical protein ACHQ6T_15575 [Myxococcota bacterium]
MGVALAFLSATSCVSDEVTVAPRPPANYERMGGTDGEACGALLLDLIPIGMGSRVQRAQSEALRKKPGATALINTELSANWVWWFVGVIHCTSVEGEAIREIARPEVLPPATTVPEATP